MLLQKHHALNISAHGRHHCPPRRVYIDLGVNWANTLLQYRQHEPEETTTKSRRAWGEWEVFGFEASPLIQPWLEEHVAWLDGRRSDAPVLCVPPTGSSKHLALWAPAHGCPSSPPAAMRSCMWKVLQPHLATLKPNPRLNSSSLLDSRLRSASPAAASHRCMGSLRSQTKQQLLQAQQQQTAPSPTRSSGISTPTPATAAVGASSTASHTRFTFIPAAAAAGGGFLWIWNSAEQIIRGGGHSSVNFGGGGPGGGPPSEALEEGKPHDNWHYVRSVDVGRWLTASFSPRDHVVLKMDSTWTLLLKLCAKALRSLAKRQQPSLHM